MPTLSDRTARSSLLLLLQRYFCSFYLPKLLLVSTYVGVAAAMFVLHGRVRSISIAQQSKAQRPPLPQPPHTHTPSSSSAALSTQVPDRINMADGATSLEEDQAQFALMVALCASVICVGLWLSFLVSQVVYRLGWKKVLHARAAHLTALTHYTTLHSLL